jgi:uncharacterized protein YbjT (DUF2867 family)
MILITTAGKVGSETARLLAERDEPVRLVVHTPEKAAAASRSGVDVVVADLEDPEAVDRAMDGVRSVLLVTPPVVPQELNVIASAVRAGAGHVVKITTKATADSPIARRRNHVAIEQALIGSGLGYTLLRNNAYMQNFLMMATGIAQADAFSTATGDGKVGHVDARDIAAVAAEITASPAAHVGKTYWPTGPEALSGAEVAEVFSRVLGRTITFHPIPYEEQLAIMLGVGIPRPVAEDTARAVALMAEGDCDYVTSDVADIIGRQPGSFEEFVKDYAGAFAPAPAGPLA